MKKIVSLLVLFALFAFPAVIARAAMGQNDNQSTVPQNRKRPHKYEGHRRHRGIGRAFGKAGKSAGRGGKEFGKNIYHGKPIKASRRLGKGAGGFGKHSGQGGARIGRKVGHKIKKVLH
jgi:hypothetical protein